MRYIGIYNPKIMPNKGRNWDQTPIVCVMPAYYCHRIIRPIGQWVIWRGGWDSNPCDPGGSTALKAIALGHSATAAINKPRVVRAHIIS